MEAVAAVVVATVMAMVVVVLISDDRLGHWRWSINHCLLIFLPFKILTDGSQTGGGDGGGGGNGGGIGGGKSGVDD